MKTNVAMNPETGLMEVIAAPGGVDTNVQYNNTFGFGGDANFTWNKDTEVLTATNISTTGLTLTGFTQGSTLFVGASGVIAEDNANNFWDNTNKRQGYGTTTPDFDLNIKKGSALSSFGLDTFSTTSGHRPVIFLRKSRNNTIGDFTTTVDAEPLADILVYGVGTAQTGFNFSAGIRFFQDGAAGSTVVPTRIDLQTSPGGVTPAASVVSIKSDPAGNYRGFTGFGTENPLAPIDIVNDFASSVRSTSYHSVHSPTWFSRKARGTEASPTSALNGDSLGFFGFQGFSTVGVDNFYYGAVLQVFQTGNATATTIPSDVVIKTSDSSTALNEVARFTKDKRFAVGTTIPTRKVEIFKSTNDDALGIRTGGAVQTTGLAGEAVGMYSDGRGHFVVSRSSNDAFTNVWGALKSRGTHAAKLDVIDGDALGIFQFIGYKSGFTSASTQIKSEVDGVPGTFIPGRIIMTTTSATGANIEAIRITSAQKTGFKQPDPLSTVDINGSFAAKTTAKTASFTADDLSFTYKCDATSGAIVATLPNTAVINRIYSIGKIDSSANAVTISGTGLTVIITAQKNFYQVQFDGTNWAVIGSHTPNTNEFHINSIDDFPAAVAGVITLPSGNYIFHVLITTSNRFVFEDGSFIMFTGDDAFNTGIVYTGTGVAFTATDFGSWITFNVLLVATQATKVFDMTSVITATPNIFFNSTSFLGASGVAIGNIDRCDTWGLLNAAFIGFDDGIILDNVTLMALDFFQMTDWNDAGGTYITVNSGTTSGLISTGAFIGTGSSETIFDFKAAVTYVGVTASNLDVDGDATIFEATGRNQQTNGFEFSGNVGILDTIEAGTNLLITNATATIISSTNVPVPVLGTFISGISLRVTNTSDGKMTYTGDKNIYTKSEANFRAFSAGGTKIPFSFYFRCGNSTDFTITSVGNAGGGDITITAGGMARLADGDQIFLDGTSYDGFYTVSNVTSTTFDVTAAFGATSTGEWSLLVADSVTKVDLSSTDGKNISVLAPISQHFPQDYMQLVVENNSDTKNLTLDGLKLNAFSIR